MRCGEHYFELPSEHLSMVAGQDELPRDYLGNLQSRGYAMIKSILP